MGPLVKKGDWGLLDLCLWRNLKVGGPFGALNQWGALFLDE